MDPAQQCLGADHASRRDIKLRLIGEEKLAIFYCFAQLDFRFLTGLHLAVYFHIIQPVDASSIGLCLVERDVGVAQKFVRNRKSSCAKQ